MPFIPSAPQQAQAPGPGDELDYDEITTNATSTATSEGTATTFLTSVCTVDGSTKIRLEFYTSLVENPSGVFAVISLYDGGSALGEMGRSIVVGGVAAVPYCSIRYLTPTAGTHTYTLRLWGGAGTKTVSAGTGASGTPMPAFLRITRA